jgi:hypothetical protein
LGDHAIGELDPHVGGPALGKKRVIKDEGSHDKTSACSTTEDDSSL